MKSKITGLLNKNYKIFLLLFFLLLYLFGISHLRNVGINYDEGTEQSILKMNDYALQKFFNPEGDAVKYYEKTDLVPIYNSVEKDHGIAMYYPFIPFLNLDKISPHTLSFAWHFYTFTLSFVGIIFFYLLIKELWNNRFLGILLTLMFFFTPRIFGDSLYNNKDSILLALSSAQLYFGLRFIRKKNYPSAVFLGVASALACNLKITGFFTFGFIGIFYLIDLTKNKLWNKKNFLVGLYSILICLGLFILITPAIWTNGFHLIDYFSWCLQNSVRFSRNWGRVYFEGQLFEHDTHPLPWYYLPKIMFLTLPIYISVLFIISLVKKVLDVKNKKEIERFVLLVLLLFLIPIFVACVSNPNIYNGWRHFYFLYVSMLVFISYGVKWLLETKYRKVVIVILLFFIGANALGMHIYDTYSSAYYNALAFDAGENYEMDYYGVTATKGLKEFSEQYKEKIYIYNLNAWAVEVNHYYLEQKYKDKIVMIKNEEELKAVLEEGIKPYYYHCHSYDQQSYKWIEDKKGVYDIKAFGHVIASIYQ